MFIEWLSHFLNDLVVKVACHDGNNLRGMFENRLLLNAPSSHIWTEADFIAIRLSQTENEMDQTWF